MAVKVPIRTVFDGSTATGLAEYQSGEFIGLTHGGTGASLSIGSAGQVLKVNSGASALEFGSVEAILNIDGMTDGSSITIADGDDFAISDDGTEKKVNASQIATYVAANLSALAITSLDIDGGTDIGAGLADADLFIVDDGAGGTNRKTAASRIKTYIADVTLTTAAQTNITSLGTLTALQVDNLNINGNTLSSTAGTDLLINPLSGQQIVLDGTIVIDAGVVTGATSITSTAFVGNITGNVTGNTSGTAATVTSAAQTNITSLGTLTALTVDNIAINGTNIGHTSDTDSIAIASDGKVTFTQQIIGTSLDISGDVDIDGTLEADAITVDGTTLAEFISDTTGAMFSSNTETGITATYQDGDNTIDLALAAAQTTITSLLATDIKIGEDDQTKIDFETADEIHFYAANAEQVFVSDGVFGPQTDSDVDLGTNSVRFKDAYIDTITTTGVITSGSNLVIANNGNIGSAGDTDAIAIDSSGNVTASQNLVVTGNFTVNGTTTTVNTTNMKVSDTLIELNTGAGSNANDMGIIMERGSTGDNAIFMFDESADEFTVGTTTATNDATGNISITAGTFTAATLKGNLVVADAGNIGSASDTDAIAIAADGVVTFSQVPVFPNNTVESADIQADAITGAKIADNAINSEHYTDGSIDTAHIADANVTLAKIADAAANTVIVRDANSSGVLSAKAVSNTQILIGDGTGFTAAALSGDVTMTNAGVVTIANTAVETAMIAADAITGAKIADDAINSEHYTDGSIDTAHIADAQVTAPKLGGGVIGAVGFSATTFDLGTNASGTETLDEANGNFQKGVNGGAHTLAPQSNDSTIVVQYTNNASAGTITVSGYDTVTGDSLTTTNGHDFLMFSTVIGSFQNLNVVALQ